MLLALSIMMFTVPSLFSVVIHNYLRHGELSRKRKLELLVVYLVLINFVTFAKMKELITDDDRTVIIVSHSIETLNELCDRVM